MTTAQAHSKVIKVAINGFGRIGRAAFKIIQDTSGVEVVAINDLANSRVLAHLLKYDTPYGIYPKDVYVEEDGRAVRNTDYRGEKDFYMSMGTTNTLVVDGKHTTLLSIPDPKELPWKDLGIDVVIECTGRFVENDAALSHIDAGAKRVVVSAPVKGGTTPTYIFGANHDKYDAAPVISNASCTTNSISPVVSVLHQAFGIRKSLMTTIHAVTAGQNVVDGPPSPKKPDLRRARAASWNMVPTTTGAAKATTQAITDLANKFDGISVRVPIVTGSLSDITMLLNKRVSVEDVNKALIQASQDKYYSKYLAVTYEPIVSSDIIGSPFSSIVDLTMTKVVDGDLVKVLAWYDNEWGYSNRLVEMSILAASSIK